MVVKSKWHWLPHKQREVPKDGGFVFGLVFCNPAHRAFDTVTSSSWRKNNHGCGQPSLQSYLRMQGLILGAQGRIFNKIIALIQDFDRVACMHLDTTDRFSSVH